MLPFKKFLFSSIGKKYVMAMTGIALIGFLVTHLAANLTLLTGDPDLINAYGHNLKTMLGPFFIPAELGLGLLFVIHAAMAIWINLDKKDAVGSREASGFVGMKSRYQNQKGKGGPSKFGFAASNMIISGAVLIVFLFFHIWQFRWQTTSYGTQWMTDLNGEQVADLYRYCAVAFADWWVVGIYVGTLLFLGLHLRHGFWSWIQSLGAMKPEWSKGIYAIALLVALVFAVGFLIIPIWMHFDVAGQLK